MPLPSLIPDRPINLSAHPLATALASTYSNPLEVSRWMLFSMGIRIDVCDVQRLPQSPFLIISNHRSFLDAPLLMAATARPVHFACHHYMAQVPVMRSVIKALGCFPLDEPNQRGRTFFKQATRFLRSQKSIGVFPEGTGPMVELTPPDQVGPFHRGFAHLALRMPVPDLQVVPAAIIALEEQQQDTVPFKVLSWFDPSEPLFKQTGRHPAVIYRRVAVVVGEPIAVTDALRQDYRGKRAAQTASELSDRCHNTIQTLLSAGSY
ncbi:MAG: lysophospholipid acyltransferase family protein [Phormidesmis sp.]